MSSDFGKIALREAEKRGASYSDVRFSEILDEGLSAKNGEPETVSFRNRRDSGFAPLLTGHGVSLVRLT